ncbi:hypothetical protein PJL18_02499 [Paenarthrobacter nicotinovorans]|nr:hypothetical protein [Paenarthrobacter nicotinovorans]
MRQIAHVMEGETKVLGDVSNDVLAERAGGVPDPFEDLLCLGFILGEIVTALTHHGTQLAVRAAGLFRRRDLLVKFAFEFLKQPHLRLQDIQRKPRADADFGQVQRLVERSALVPFQLDFQGSATARRLRPEQLVDAHVEGRSELLKQPQFGFALAVFDQAQLAWRGPDGGTQVIERQPRLLAQMAHAAAKADDVQFGGRRGQRRRRDFAIPAHRRHFLRIREEVHFFP